MADDGKNFPTIFRIDRIANLIVTKQHFNIPYKDKFNDGEFRKRVQFMYSDELQRVTFEISGTYFEMVMVYKCGSEVKEIGLKI